MGLFARDSLHELRDSRRHEIRRQAESERSTDTRGKDARVTDAVTNGGAEECCHGASILPVRVMRKAMGQRDDGRGHKYR